MRKQNENKKGFLGKVLKSALTVGLTAFAILGGGMLYQAMPSATPSVAYACSDSYYILPYSDCEYISQSDLSGMDSYTLRLARNEIYARHGRLFKTDSVQEYFDCQDWYYGYIPASQFDESVFNKYEEANIATIKKAEKNRKSYNTPTAKSSSYIISYSSSAYLDYSDIEGMSSSTLRKARNEIYARHGRRFNDSSLQSYFNSKSWYSGYIDPEDFDESVLNSYEKANVAFILSYE